MKAHLFAGLRDLDGNEVGVRGATAGGEGSDAPSKLPKMPKKGIFVVGDIDMKTERTLALIDDLLRIRRAQTRLPGDQDLAAVRCRIEAEIGPTLSQRAAGAVLGVSHTAVQRWIARGDIPVVPTATGRQEIPVAALLRLKDAVDRERQGGTRSRHLLESIVMRDHERAAEIRRGLARSEADDVDDPHDRAQRRALEYHAVVAQRLNRRLISEARQNLFRWRSSGRIHPRYAAQWEAVLDRPIRDIRRAITSDDQTGRDLRQNSPFAGALSEAERGAIFDRAA